MEAELNYLVEQLRKELWAQEEGAREMFEWWEKHPEAEPNMLVIGHDDLIYIRQDLLGDAPPERVWRLN
jgi:hypothetical protein